MKTLKQLTGANKGIIIYNLAQHQAVACTWNNINDYAHLSDTLGYNLMNLTELPDDIKGEFDESIDGYFVGHFSQICISSRDKAVSFFKEKILELFENKTAGTVYKINNSTTVIVPKSWEEKVGRRI